MNQVLSTRMIGVHINIPFGGLLCCALITARFHSSSEPNTLITILLRPLLFNFFLPNPPNGSEFVYTASRCSSSYVTTNANLSRHVAHNRWRFDTCNINRLRRYLQLFDNNCFNGAFVSSLLNSFFAFQRDLINGTLYCVPPHLENIRTDIQT